MNQHTVAKDKKLSNSFKPFLWSYDFNSIDPKRNKKTIIVNVINYGNLSDWKKLVKQYGLKNVSNTLSIISATEIRPGARKLASLLFSIKHFNHASRSSH
jgi:hypothetical protein